MTKTMWDVVRLETGRRRVNLELVDTLLTPDGSRYVSAAAAVDAVNTHFVNAATTCGAPTADVAAALHALRGARAAADRSLRFKNFTPLEVFKIISNGVAHKTTKDIYEISVSLVHAAAAPLSYILSVLFNLCLREGHYPQPLKNVRVSPLYKGKGKKEDINSYRPVSIIPAIAKVFEYGISGRLTEYLADTQALSDRQYAYRSGRSTTDVARELVTRVLKAREDGLQVAVMLCDLSKAFDVADHNVLSAKLAYYGINGPALSLMCTFMTNRAQTVTAGGEVKSEPLKTAIGVAQGSSLSNIMFSLLLNDLPDCIGDAHTLMYADDVAAVVTAPTLDGLERRLNKVAAGLHEWFNNNGFLMNVTKTNFLHFNLAGRTYRNLDVSIKGASITQVKHTAFLGFRVDQGLTWELHIDNLCKRLGRACFALWRLSGTLEKQMTRSCYFASVHSLLQYGVDLWGRAADWERAFRMQKRAVRAIVRVSWDTSARPLFRELKIMTVPALVIFSAAMYAREHLEEYARVGDSHRYPTRHAERLQVADRWRLAKSGKLVQMMAPDVYNRLPKVITATPSTQTFKVSLKAWLIEQAIYNVNDFFEENLFTI